MKTISIINLKGGVAKTLSAVNMAHILAAVHNKRVLLVDNDKQGNASKMFGLHSYEKKSVADILTEKAPALDEIIAPTRYENLDLINSVSQIISGLMSVIGGLINFITGVFTGNWAQAWEGVKNIFKGIFDTLAGIVKAPINAIIGIINGAISGINKVGFDIPDWVPFVGGKQFRINIPQIPMLAKGSRNAPDTFIAGERGPELITNGKGRTVFTALQTERIMSNAGAAQQGAQQVIITLAPALIAALAAAPAVSTVHSAAVVPQMQAAELQAAPVQQGGTVFRFESAPVFNVNGGDPEDIDQKFQQYYDETMQGVEEMLRQREADERRGRYE